MSHSSKRIAISCIAAALVVGTVSVGGPANAEPFAYAPSPHRPSHAVEENLPDVMRVARRPNGDALASALRRRVVEYHTREAPGTIVIDAANTHLYLVLGDGRAIRYGIGVGRDGFTWSGVKSVERKSEWPDWHPPAEMLARQPYLPRFMAGGPGNPLGARALYLGGSLYRIHGTNDPSTIGNRVSSGCFRMLNEDVIDLYARVNIGAKVVVLPTAAPRAQRARTRAAEARQPARGPIRTVSVDGPRAQPLN
jgi:lipoprotein-anchoring transpeptidase ErfK/SrfK